jgi:carboxyl-terminal processing protease
MNTVKRKVLRTLLIAGTLTYAIISLSFVDNFFEQSKNLDIFASTYKEVSTYYVDEIKPGEFIRTGIDAMLGSLDPYTQYIPESEIEDFRMHYVSNQYGGLGATILENKGQVVISEVYQDFPAQKAGLEPGDVIVEVNGKNVKGMQSADVSAMMKGQAGTNVKMSVKREGVADPIAFSIKREEIKNKNVPYYGMVNDSVGYIKLNAFLQSSAHEVKVALMELQKKPHLKGMILDLRGNGGGILQESVDIVNLFVDKGEHIVSQKGRIDQTNQEYKTLNPAVAPNLPLTVLVDGNSASASEIAAGSLQDLDRAVIIGRRSYGKGLVQQTKPLPYNAQVKITIAKYYIPSGRCIQKLNYAKRDANGHAIVRSDSSLAEFKTKNGRSVYDGSGVFPDRETASKSLSPITRSLFTGLNIFEFANNYKRHHPAISNPSVFKIDDQDYTDFVKYLNDKDFSYTTQSERDLALLKQSAEKEKYLASSKDEFSALEAKIKQDKKEDLTRHREEIEPVLASEIALRYFYQDGQIECSFKYDADIKEALKVLGDHKLYADILRGNGNYHTIGKPVLALGAKADTSDDDGEN